MTKPIKRLTIVYDGDCPFCSRYVDHVRLREAAERVEYVNARDGGKVVEEARARGFDLDEGMLAIVDGEYHHGADAINVMARLSEPAGILNRLNHGLFRWRAVARLLYPAMRACRNAVLRVLGRPPLSSS
jgi:predicted DCC family thiol-disulfide oxidoreductase YuxK